MMVFFPEQTIQDLSPIFKMMIIRCLGTAKWICHIDSLMYVTKV